MLSFRMFGVRAVGLLTLLVCAATPGAPALAAAARIVADLNPRPLAEPFEGHTSAQRGWVAIGEATYFVADDGVRGRELWRTDSTRAGTRMVRDLYPGQTGSGPRGLVEFHDQLYFGAADLDRGCGLWRTDGSAAGTESVFTFLPRRHCERGSSFAYDGPMDLAAVGDAMLFSANDGMHGRELWASDGTAAGTRMVANLNGEIDPSNPSRELGASPGLLTTIGDIALFAGHSLAAPQSDDRWLWRSDGSAAGTFALLEHPPIPTNPEQSSLTRLGDLALFALLRDDVLELWRSDGRSDGTFPLGAFFRHREPLVATWNGRAYFFSAVGSQVQRVGLWRTDGTEAGTEPVAIDLPERPSPPRPLAGPRELAPSGGQLFFTLGAASHLWVSDGTADGTRAVERVGDPEVPLEAQQLSGFAGGVLFAGNDAEAGCGLRFADRTAGDRAVADLEPATAPCHLSTAFETVLPIALHVGSHGAVFLADDGAHGGEPWLTDGTAQGTRLLRDIDARSARTQDADPTHLIALPDRLVFAANDGTRWALFAASLDGATVHRLLDLDGGAVAGARLGDQAVYMIAAGDDVELWRSDGTEVGTTELTSFPRSTAAVGMTTAGDSLYFQIQIGTRYQLWRSDGTSPGAVELGTFHSPIGFVGELRSGHVAFIASTPTAGSELWRTDGTAGGTMLVLDVRPGVAGGVFGASTLFDGHAYFVANDGVHGNEVWRSDGTPAGTGLFAELVEGPAGIGFPVWAQTDDDLYLYFAHDDDMFTCRRELWATDGSVAGTRPLASAQFSECVAAPMPLVATDDQAFFVGFAAGSGVELWRTDGSPDGTRITRDINPGPAGGLALGETPVRLARLYLAGRHAVFLADDGQQGMELWTSDGTADGTEMLTDFDSRLSSTRGNHGGFVPLGESLAFFAFESGSGFEPWITDGTPAGTRQLANIAPGALSSFPSSSHMPGDDEPLWPAGIAIDGRLFLVADDAATGIELWSVPLDRPDPECAGDCDGSSGVTVDELVRGVAIALGMAPAGICAALDRNRDGTAAIDELVTAVGVLLDGCTAKAAASS